MYVPGHRRRVLLTGGIGSGKSTVSALLRRRGAVVIDADTVGRRVLEPGGAAFQRVAARWPEVVRSGRIDRAALAEIVFADAAELRALEDLTHPHIRAAIAQAAAAAAPGSVVVAEVPVAADLVGTGWVVVVVDAPDRLRIERAVARGLSPEQAVARMAAQPAREEWLAMADRVVPNHGDLAALESEVAALWRWLLAGDTADRDDDPPGGYVVPGGYADL